MRALGVFSGLLHYYNATFRDISISNPQTDVNFPSWTKQYRMFVDFHNFNLREPHVNAISREFLNPILLMETT
jgi:hypothetical protein